MLDGNPAVSGPASGRRPGTARRPRAGAAARVPSPSTSSSAAARTGEHGQSRAGAGHPERGEQRRQHLGERAASVLGQRAARATHPDHAGRSAGPRASVSRIEPVGAHRLRSRRGTVGCRRRDPGRLDRRGPRLDDGAVLLGGAPPRMLRLAPAARGAAASTARLHGRRPDLGGARPQAARRRHRAPGSALRPLPRRRCPTPRLGRPTRLVRAGRRTGRTAGSPGCSPRCRRARRAIWSSTTARPTRPRSAPSPSGRGRVLRHPTAPGPGRGPQRRARRRRAPRWSRSSTPTWCPQPGWLDPLLARVRRPGGRAGRAADRRAAAGRAAGWAGYEAVRSSLDLGPDAGAGGAALAGSPTCRAPRWWCAATPSAPGFDERMHVAEDVDLVLRLHAAGWRLRYEPAARVAHDHRTDAARLVAAQGVLRHRRRPAGAAPPRGGAADGAQPVVGRRSAGCCCSGGRGRCSRPPRWSAVRDRAAGPAADRCSGRGATAARLVGLGAVGAVGADRGRRHPALLAAVGCSACLVSRRARRTVLAVALAEGVRRLVAPPRPGSAGAARPAGLPARPPARRPRLRRGPVVGGAAAPHASQPLRPVGTAAPVGRSGRSSRSPRPPSGLVRTGDPRSARHLR